MLGLMPGSGGDVGLPPTARSLLHLNNSRLVPAPPSVGRRGQVDLPGGRGPAQPGRDFMLPSTGAYSCGPKRGCPERSLIPLTVLSEATAWTRRSRDGDEGGPIASGTGRSSRGRLASGGAWPCSCGMFNEWTGEPPGGRYPLMRHTVLWLIFGLLWGLLTWAWASRSRTCGPDVDSKPAG